MIPVAASQVETFRIRESHKEDKRLYYECNDVEKELLKHIQDTLEEQCIEHLIDEDISLIQDGVPITRTTNLRIIERYLAKGSSRKK